MKIFNITEVLDNFGDSSVISKQADDTIDVTLANMDKDLTKAKQSIKDYEEESATETAEWMKDLDNLRKELEIHRRKDCNECKDKTETNVYLKQLYKEFVHFMEGSTFKCKLCNKLLADNKEVVNHTISEHEAKKFMEKTFNMKVCLKTKHYLYKFRMHVAANDGGRLSFLVESPDCLPIAV